MNQALELLATYGYLVVLAVLLFENLGLPLPGLALRIVAGALAAAAELGAVVVSGRLRLRLHHLAVRASPPGAKGAAHGEPHGG